MPSRRYCYQVVDVFTRVPLEGNALAVFPKANDMDDVTMQRIARELNLSETVFVQDTTASDCIQKLRIFTPSREMLFAGHPTIGAVYVLLKQGSVPSSMERFSVEEKVGAIPIRVEKADPPMVWLETPAISFEKTFPARYCIDMLRLDVTDLCEAEPQILNAGNPTLLIPAKSKSIVDHAALDIGLFSQIENTYGKPLCVFVFTPTDEGAYSRMFAPSYGILEDPATGSSTGPLAAFMKRHAMLANDGVGRFVSEQGTKIGRRSLLYFEISQERDNDVILVGGYVTPLVEAIMTLPS